MFTFHVMGRKNIRAIIENSRPEIFARVRQTYLAHHRGETINPNSYFLLLPDKRRTRGSSRCPGAARRAWRRGHQMDRQLPRQRRAQRSRAPRPCCCSTTSRPATRSPVWRRRRSTRRARRHRRCSGRRHCTAQASLGAARGDRGRRHLPNILDSSWALGWTIGRRRGPRHGRGLREKSAGHAGALGYPAGTAATLAGAVDGADLVVLATTAGSRTSWTRAPSPPARPCSTSRCATSRPRSSPPPTTSWTTWSTA